MIAFDWSCAVAHSHIVSAQPAHTRLLFFKLHRNQNWKQKRSQQTGLANLISGFVLGSYAVFRCTNNSQRNSRARRGYHSCRGCMDHNATALLRNRLAGDTASNINTCHCLRGHTSHCFCLHPYFHKLSLQLTTKLESRENLPLARKLLSRVPPEPTANWVTLLNTSFKKLNKALKELNQGVQKCCIKYRLCNTHAAVQQNYEKKARKNVDCADTWKNC